MITAIKIAGLAALLSTGLVTGLHGFAAAPAAGSGGKLYADRLSDGPAAPAILATASLADVNGAAKGDRLESPSARPSAARWVMKQAALATRDAAGRTSTLAMPPVFIVTAAAR